MNKDVLHTDVQKFIFENISTDIVSILLKKPFFEKVSNQELAQQLEARKKCEKKLPTWFGTPKMYYPHKLNIEQTSSEIMAWYKSEIVSEKSLPEAPRKTLSNRPTESLLDATGGFGVDSYFFAKKMEQVIHCEIDEPLSQIAAHNFKILGVKNIRCIPSDGIDYLGKSKDAFDWTYLDPSRRDEKKAKVFRLSECRPDVPKNLELLFSKAKNILLKTSPLLDFSIGISELRFVKEIHVVALKNEVKELLWVLEKGFTGDITVRTINFLKNNVDAARLPRIELLPSMHSERQFFLSQSRTTKADKITTSQIPLETFDFRLSEEKESVALYSSPLSYLYEPNAAILKSGAFKTVGDHFGLKKIHEHTHLYTSDSLIDFPGRRFKLIETVPYNKKYIKQLGIEKANVSTRNFPKSVADIRKIFKIKEGGAIYLFFATDQNGKSIALQCSQI